MDNSSLLGAEESAGSSCDEKVPMSITSTFDSDENESSKSNNDDDSCSVHQNILADEFSGMIKLSAPVVGTYLLEMLPGTVSLILVGHIRADGMTEEIISATAISTVYMNLFGISIGVGLCTAMDTLCSQAFGAGQSQRMGVYLQTGAVVLSFTFVIVCFLFYFSVEILVLLRQPVEAAELSGKFILYLLPGVPFLYCYEMLRRVLQAQNIAVPMVYVAILANVINIIIGYYLVFFTSLGWLGAAVARTICNMSLPLLLIPYMYWSGLYKSFWTGIHVQEAFRGVVEFLILGVPGMLQLCFEWWAFEVLSIICGLLPDAVISISANAILLNISSNTYMFYLGFSIAGSVRIGNALGAGDPKRASLASYLTIGMSASIALLCGTMLFVFRKQLPFLFTHDEEINGMAKVLVGLSAFFQIPDAVNAAVQGIFRGSGRQYLGAQLNFVGYYILGIPIGCLLAFKFHYGVIGLWYGMTLGLLLISGCGTVLVSLSRWGVLVEKARDRTQNTDSLPIHEEPEECQKLVTNRTSNFGSCN